MFVILKSTCKSTVTLIGPYASRKIANRVALRLGTASVKSKWYSLFEVKAVKAPKGPEVVR